MKTKTLNPELLSKMDAYWRAANSRTEPVVPCISTIGN